MLKNYLHTHAFEKAHIRQNHSRPARVIRESVLIWRDHTHNLTKQRTTESELKQQPTLCITKLRGMNLYTQLHR